jgi:hypothetical protein
MTAPSLPLRLARWFDHRLQESCVVPSVGVRMFGLEIVDAASLDDLPSPAVRVVLIAEAADLDQLVRHPEAVRGLDFDATALVEHPWLVVPPGPAPHGYRGRRRVRTVQVVSPHGTATVTRFLDDPSIVVLHPAA